MSWLRRHRRLTAIAVGGSLGLMAVVAWRTTSPPSGRQSPARTTSPTVTGPEKYEATVFGCTIRPSADPSSPDVTLTDSDCTNAAVVGRYCHESPDTVEIASQGVRTNGGLVDTFTFTGAQGGARLAYFLDDPDDPRFGWVGLDCYARGGPTSLAFSPSEWKAFSSPSGEVTEDLAAFGLGDLPAVTTTTTHRPPKSQTAESTRALAIFNGLKATSCKIEPQASQIPVAVSASPVAGRYLITDAGGNQLVLDPSAETVSSTAGVGSELPPVYTFGCDPEIFIGTSD